MGGRRTWQIVRSYRWPELRPELKWYDRDGVSTDCRRPPEVKETHSLVTVEIWGEAYGLLLSHGRFVKISNVTQKLESTLERVSKVSKMSRLIRVIVWGDMDGSVLSRDRFIEISNVAQMLEPTMEEDPEVVYVYMHVRVVIWGEADG